MLDILFLGTGASIPSRDRSMPSVAVRCGTDTILFDCGEGTQRQLMISPFSFMKIKGIFITHMHGDHTFGLPGLLQTMELSGRKDKLVLCGPEGFIDGFKDILSLCEGQFGYELDTMEMSGGETVRFDSFTVSSFRTEHMVPSIGYVLSENESKGRFDRQKAVSLGIRPGPDFTRLQNGETVNNVRPDMVMGPSRPGCRVVYSGDTVPCQDLSEAATGADVLIHESTYAHEEAYLAADYGHSTSVQAADTAKRCGCRALFLIHTSNRYDDKSVLVDEAKGIFENSILPNDLDLYKISKNEIRSV